ncbi:MAG: anthranilate phosphoribosyltransferase [Candidatus Micrarchaeota archaeon]
MENILQKLAESKDLASKEAEGVMQALIDINVNLIQASAILTALRMKGETIDEITAFAKVMKQNAICIKPNSKFLVDTCGTGGDSLGTFNVSTTAMFVVAGAGCAVAKHGNRATSSSCGSADVLEHLGININMAPKDVERCIERIGLGFMFAPIFHPAMKNVAPIRKELGIRTIFNILGPLTNPASAPSQIIGVYKPELTKKIAEVARNLGIRRALVVHGSGIDEICLHGTTKVSELVNNTIKTYEIEPKGLGLKRAEIDAIRTNSKQENVQILLDILNGKKSPHREIVLANAGAAIYVSGKAESITEGILLAKESIDSGNAKKKLGELIHFSER